MTKKNIIASIIGVIMGTIISQVGLFFLMLILHGSNIAFKTLFFIGKIPELHFQWVALITTLMWGGGWLSGYYSMKKILK